MSHGGIEIVAPVLVVGETREKGQTKAKRVAMTQRRRTERSKERKKEHERRKVKASTQKLLKCKIDAPRAPAAFGSRARFVPHGVRRRSFTTTGRRAFSSTTTRGRFSRRERIPRYRPVAFEQSACAALRNTGIRITPCTGAQFRRSLRLIKKIEDTRRFSPIVRAAEASTVSLCEKCHARHQRRCVTRSNCTLQLMIISFSVSPTRSARGTWGRGSPIMTTTTTTAARVSESLDRLVIASAIRCARRRE